MRKASAERRKMDTPFNNNLPTPSSYVIVNPIHPENPDSKPVAAARIISTKNWVPDVFLER